MRALFFLIGLLVVAMSMSACQTSRAVSFAYRDATYGGEAYKPSDRTSVLFLMDGFSSEMLRTSLRNKNVPNIADAFSLTPKARFSYGRAVFPSLTFPNITSILTGQSDADHPITGNKIVIDNKVIDFENIVSWRDLALTLQRRTIFYKLAAQSQASVSYSYAFSGGATAYQDASAAAVAGYLENDFVSIDTQTLSSLKRLLAETESTKWPRFIFVHVIGIDATAHANGPLDESVQSYIHSIDAQLGEIFEILNHPDGTAAPTHHVNYAMTADHGFKTTPDHSPLENVVAHMNRKLRLVSDNRVASLYVDEPSPAEDRFALATAILQVPHVAWAAVKTEDGVDLLRKSGDRAHITIAKTKCPNGERAARFEWISKSATTTNPMVFTCLSDFDLATGPDDDSYIVPALVDYFQSPTSPDMVFIPDDHSDFASGYAGNHGGLSRDEMLVPVLTKDVDISRGIHPTYELIRTMGVDP